MELGAYQNFIGGVWTDGDAKETFAVVNPATEETIATVPNATASDVLAAIDAANAVQSKWADSVAADRAKILRAAAQMMRERVEHLARVMTLEEGKPLAEARGEVAYAASFLDWFAEEAVRVYGDTIPSSSRDKRILVLKTASRNHCRHYALEFPISHDHPQARSRAGGRLHDDCQAVGIDAAIRLRTGAHI